MASAAFSSAGAGLVPPPAPPPTDDRELRHHDDHDDDGAVNHHYQETSGSNSGDDDDRDLMESGKRMGGHLNGFSAKKRRKQSKPIRLGGDSGPLFEAETEAEAGSGSGADEHEEGELVRYPHLDDLEEGERRGLGQMLPLNLSSGKDDGLDKRPLRVLGPELMQQPFLAGLDLDPGKLPHLPSSIYGGMLSLGMPPFPFPFPNSPMVSTMSRTPTTPTSSSAGMRTQIFNPEAYCDLCNKEFCNKYFLKTHKANKHGIYSDSPSGLSRSPGPPTSGPGGLGTSPVSFPQQHQNQQPMSRPEAPEPPTSVGGPPTPGSHSHSGSPFSGAFIAANMGALRPPFLPLSPGASPSPSAKETGGADCGRDSSSASSVDRPGSSGPGHMVSPRGHNGMDERDRMHQQQQMRREREFDEQLRKSAESLGLPPHLANFNPLSMFSGMPSLEAMRKEDDLRKADHQVQMDLPPGMSRPIPNIPNIPSISSLPNSGNNGSSPGMPMPKGPFTPDKLRQMGVINADAFCEICCKEFCNKYFLRVHKLKKHGICSPDLPPEKVQKILNQMAKEAGKTGNPPPPIVRPPPGLLGSGLDGPGGLPKKMPAFPGAGSLGPLGPVNLSGLRPPPPSLNSLMQLPPLEPLLPQALKDFPGMLASRATPTSPADTPLPPVRPSSAEREREVLKVSDDSTDAHRDPSSQSEDEDGSKRSREESRSPAQAPHTPHASEDLQRLQSMIMELNTNKAKPAGVVAAAGETVCKVCGKDMENKYFLRAHMMNEHNMLHMEEIPQLPMEPLKQPPQPPRAEQHQVDQRERSSPFDPRNGGAEGVMVPPPMPNVSAADLATRFLQQMQQGFGSNLSPLNSDEMSFLERVKSELAGGSGGNSANGGGGSNGGGSSPKKPQEKDPNRKPASLSRSYCEICKKELCNKYFMKTHMMKMHGINIESTSQTGVSCHLCKKELCSKYFLKVHLQNSHGIMEDGSPVPPGLGDNLFTGLFPPPPGMGHGQSPDKDRYFSRLLGEQSELSRERMECQKQQGHTCSLCGEAFLEIVGLQVHIIKSHGGGFTPESAAAGMFGLGPLGHLQDSKSSSDGEEELSRHNDEDGGSRAEHDRDEDSAAAKDDSGNAEQQPGHDHRQHQRPLPPAPKLSAAFPFPGLEGLTPPAGDAAKQFPHIEMLQRHMLSAQFPGLISPLLSGFPGFPTGASGLPFPNPLQHFLSGGLTAGAVTNINNNGHDVEKKAEVKKAASPAKTPTTSTPKKSSKSSSKVFKCSKCGDRFARRDLCLAHIHSAHAGRDRKKATSPSLAHCRKRRSASRSQYVRQLMELLRVPTSRGTPAHCADDVEAIDNGPSRRDDPDKGHIMQPFLLKAPAAAKCASPGAHSLSEAGAETGNVGDSDSRADDIHINFVPSLVYLPVAKRVSQPLTVAFSLTPA